jgi:GNAT superfamily N-acetyltransferase
VAGERRDADAVLLSSGLPVPIFNPTIVTGPLGDPAAAVRRIADHYRSLESPFVIWFRDQVTPGLADACAAAGLVEHWQPPLMVLDPLPASSPGVPEGLRVDVVTAETVADHGVVLTEGFGMPAELVGVLAVPAFVELPGFTLLVGRIGGEPVATVAAFVAEGVAGIYNVATVPSARGRGYGAALTWAAVGVGRDAGAARAILQASEQGAPVYERMGFLAPSRYRQFQPG